MSGMLQKGQRLRPRHPALAEREWGIAGDAVGTVICAYQVGLPSVRQGERVDVSFGPRLIVWGAPAAEFAPLPEGRQ
jgi:hypothetical protein